MKIFKARMTGKTASGNRWAVLQDFDNSLHITIQGENQSICERFDNLPSEEKMMEMVNVLDEELTPKMLKQTFSFVPKPNQKAE